MDLKEIISDTLKTPWIAGTRMRSLKRSVLLKFSIYSAIEELKAKKMPLKFLGILYLGFCRISNKIHEYLCEELVKFTNVPSEVQQKPRVSGIEATNNHIVNSGLRYSGARLSLMPITPRKLEGFRKSAGKTENLTTNLLEVDLRDLKYTFVSEDFIDISRNVENMSLEFIINDPDEIKTPKVSPKALQNGFKSTAKKKKLKDDFTVLKNIRNPPLKTHARIQRPIELVEIPEALKKRLKKLFGEKKVQSPQEIDLKIDLDDIHTINQPLLPEVNLPEIEPVNLEVQFEIEQSLRLSTFSPVKNTQVTNFSETLNFLIKTEGKCYFSEVIKNFDKLTACRAFSSLLVLVGTGEIHLKQPNPSSDIEILSLTPHSQFVLPHKKPVFNFY